MLRLRQKITINGKTLPFVETVEIVDSRNKFTNTCTLAIPNKIPGQNNKISNVIAKGSPVKIELGYFPYMFNEFEGYVSEVIPEKTAIIRCENEAYNIKRQSIGKDIIQKNTTLKKLINAIYAGESVISETNIGDFQVGATNTLIDVLAELQDQYKIYSYFRGSTLIVGADADPREKQTIRADFQRNVPEGESSFNFKEADADRIVVKVTSINREGAINEIYAYYEGSPAKIVYSEIEPATGAVNEFNITGQSDFDNEYLKELAKIRLEALSFTGVDGSITTYPPLDKPCATHGDICEVIDRDIPEKQGDYAIVEVTKRFGVGIGYRQILGLGISL